MKLPPINYLSMKSYRIRLKVKIISNPVNFIFSLIYLLLVLWIPLCCDITSNNTGKVPTGAVNRNVINESIPISNALNFPEIK